MCDHNINVPVNLAHNLVDCQYHEHEQDHEHQHTIQRLQQYVYLHYRGNEHRQLS